MTKSFSDWKDRIAWGVVVGGATWAGWVTTQLGTRLSSEEVAQMISNSAPYIKDRQLILSKLEAAERNEERMLKVIEQNTRAINTIDRTLVRLSTKVESQN